MRIRFSFVAVVFDDSQRDGGEPDAPPQAFTTCVGRTSSVGAYRVWDALGHPAGERPRQWLGADAAVEDPQGCGGDGGSRGRDGDFERADVGEADEVAQRCVHHERRVGTAWCEARQDVTNALGRIPARLSTSMNPSPTATSVGTARRWAGSASARTMLAYDRLRGASAPDCAVAPRRPRWARRGGCRPRSARSPGRVWSASEVRSGGAQVARATSTHC